MLTLFTKIGRKMMAHAREVFRVITAGDLVYSVIEWALKSVLQLANLTKEAWN